MNFGFYISPNTFLNYYLVIKNASLIKNKILSSVYQWSNLTALNIIQNYMNTKLAIPVTITILVIFLILSHLFTQFTSVNIILLLIFAHKNNPSGRLE